MDERSVIAWYIWMCDITVYRPGCLPLWFRHAAKFPMRFPLTVLNVKRLPLWLGASLLWNHVLKALVTVGRFIFDLCLSVSLCSASQQGGWTPSTAEHVWSRRAAHSGGHFHCCKMLESAICPCCTGACNLKYMPIQVRCSQCTNGWSQQLKHMGNFIFIFIWLNCWLGFYPVCTSKPINCKCEFLLKSEHFWTDV